MRLVLGLAVGDFHRGVSPMHNSSSFVKNQRLITAYLQGRDRSECFPEIVEI
jgi:hypothetical protein